MSLGNGLYGQTFPTQELSVPEGAAIRLSHLTLCHGHGKVCRKVNALLTRQHSRYSIYGRVRVKFGRKIRMTSDDTYLAHRWPQGFDVLYRADGVDVAPEMERN